VKRCAFTELAVRPDASAVPAHDSMHQREPDARARELIVAMQKLKHAEKILAVTRIESGAVVAHEVDVLAFFADGADLYGGGFLLRGEFNGIRQQFHPDLLEQAPIADGRRQR